MTSLPNNLSSDRRRAIGPVLAAGQARADDLEAGGRVSRIAYENVIWVTKMTRMLWRGAAEGTGHLPQPMR